MAITNRTVYTLPTLPTIGAAGSTFTDPTFGARMARATDGNFIVDIAGNVNRSFRSPASGYQRAWSIDGTKFYTIHGGNSVYLCSFDPVTMATARIGNTHLNFNGTCTFDSQNTNLLYGIGLQADGHTISKTDVTTFPFVTTALVDLDDVTGGLANPSYMGSVVEGGGYLIASYGGLSQEAMHYHVHCETASPVATAQVLDSLTRMGMDEDDSTFYSHAVQLDKTGRFALITPTVSIVFGHALAKYRKYVWDTFLDTVTPITATADSGGHSVAGFGNYLNSSAMTGGQGFDSFQIILTPDLTAPNSNRSELISPLYTPLSIFAADHTSWQNAQAGSLQPVISGMYRYYDGPNNVLPNKNEVAWRACDNEIVSVATDGTGIVTRHCHHRSQVHPDTGTASFEFWYTPRPNVNSAGTHAIFTSNWEKTLGNDSAEGNKRQDTFVVELQFNPISEPRVSHRRGDRKFFAR